MNYLSHFYLVQDQPDPYIILGMVLPDMVRNHRKSWNVHPHRYERELGADVIMAGIRRGWKLHLETDRRFHSSVFFSYHSSQLRKQIVKVLPHRPFRPFFLAHIGLELLLDSLLIVQGKVDTGKFYTQLSACGETEVVRFLKTCGIPEAVSFTPWLREFISSAYLYSYSNPGSLSYSLDRIGRRVWQTPTGPDARARLADILLAYRELIENDYLPIFEEITSYLRPL